MFPEHTIFADDYGYVSSMRYRVGLVGIYKKVFIASQITTLKHYEPTDDYVRPPNKKARLSLMDSMETYRLMKVQGVKDKTARMVIPQATYIKFTLRMSLSDIKSLYKKANSDTYDYLVLLNNMAIDKAPLMCKRLKINYVE